MTAARPGGSAVGRWLANVQARRALRHLSDSLLDEMGPLDLAEGEPDSDRWLVATDLSWLESRMAGSEFWRRNSSGRRHRSEARRQALELVPKVDALQLPLTASVLREVVRLLSAIDHR